MTDLPFSVGRPVAQASLSWPSANSPSPLAAAPAVPSRIAPACTQSPSQASPDSPLYTRGPLVRYRPSGLSLRGFEEPVAISWQCIAVYFRSFRKPVPGDCHDLLRKSRNDRSGVQLQQTAFGRTYGQKEKPCCCRAIPKITQRSLMWYSSSAKIKSSRSKWFRSMVFTAFPIQYMQKGV